jgi:hypothetical protein
MIVDDWEEMIVNTLEAEGKGHLIPQFREQIVEYRRGIHSIVELWRESGLL